MERTVYHHFHVSPLPPGGFFPPEVEKWLYENFHVLKDAKLAIDLFTTPITVVNSAAEVDIWQIDIGPEELHANSGLIIELLAAYSNASASDNFTIYIRLDESLIHTISRVDGNKTNVALSIRYNVTVGAEGTGGEIYDSSFVFDSGNTYSSSNASPHAYDTSIAHALKISFKWDNAKLGNTITFNQGFIFSVHTPGV